MKPPHFLNEKRLRDYPRLMLGVVIFVLLANVLFRDEWMGAVKQIIGGDFVTLYSGGLLYREDVSNLHNFERQGEIQKALIAPTPLWGIMPFNYPPYVAMALSLLTAIPLPMAFALWTLLTLLSTALAVHWISRYLLPGWLKSSGLSYRQLLILAFSFFPFVEGLQVGQNHGFTLLLMTGIVVFTLKGNGYLAGFLAGLAIYKPQFVIGFLIVWLAWREVKPLIAFMLTSLTWVGISILQHGFAPIQNYLNVMPILLKMPYLEGSGGYLEVTPYGFLTTVLPAAWWQGIWIAIQIFTVILSLSLGFLAYRQNKKPGADRIPILILAMLYPFQIAPHTLLHDLVIVLPVLALWSHHDRSRSLLYICVAIYLGAFILPPVTYATGVAFLAIIPVFLFWMQIRQMAQNRSTP